MGRITATVAVASFTDPAREIRCEAVVDTGAYCLTLPATWKDRLGPLQLRRAVRVQVADGRVFEGDLAGPVSIDIAGFGAAAGEVLFIHMVQDEGEYEPLIGYMALEGARLVVDMVGHRLVRLPHVDLKRVA